MFLSDGSGRAKTIGEQRRRQSYYLDTTRCETTGTPKEDVETADQRGHGEYRITVNIYGMEYMFPSDRPAFDEERNELLTCIMAGRG